MNILEKIIAHKKREVALRKQQVPLAQLEQAAYFTRTGNSLVQSLAAPHSTGIIAEFKRKSPSKGIINAKATAADVIAAYDQYRAAGISILTDTEFFGGHTEDLQQNRELTQCPLLRKDFMIDEYQVAEAKAMGADVILLIAACLTTQRVMELAGYAKILKLEVLLEIHNEAELEHICETVDLVGVNNRNLKTFVVDVETSVHLASHIPAGKIKISESGIGDVATINRLKECGYRGFLMGENFMKTLHPGESFGNFVRLL
jgi:indole-3-glycerol phosphate synthase